MGNFPDLDYHELGEPLDLVTWDSYPTGYAERSRASLYLPDEPRCPQPTTSGDPYVTDFCHAITRGIKQAPFWVMEQQPGGINWARLQSGRATGRGAPVDLARAGGGCRRGGLLPLARLPLRLGADAHGPAQA